MASSKMALEDIQSAIHQMATDAVTYLESELSPERAEATEFYQGKKAGIPDEQGRSKAVMTVVRDVVLQMLPSLLRVFFGAEKAVEYRPHGPEDVAGAEQATDFVNTVVLQQDNQGFLEFYAWFKDALIRKIGIVKSWWDDRSSYKTYTANNLDVNQLEAVSQDPEIEITVQTERSDPSGIRFYDIEYKHWHRDGLARFMALPPEEFLIARDARSLEDASFVAHRSEKTRSELLEMGVPEKELDEFGGPSTELRHSIEDIARRGGIVQEVRETDEAAVRMLWLEAYPRLDVDGDGIAELVRIRALGPGHHIVGDPEPVDRRPFALLCPDPEPHVVIGQSVADRLMDLQKIDSGLLRGMFDSLSNALFPDVAYQRGRVNLQDLTSTATSKNIETFDPPGTVLMEFAREFAGAPILQVLEHMERVKTQRVGPMPATLDPDALQSSTAKAVNATVQAASDQLELIARIFAETGVKKLFKDLLALLVEHQPRTRMVRLRNQYVAIDPRSWDATMDVSVNVALGTGLVEEKLAVLGATAAKQEQILQALGPANPLVTIGQLRHTYAKMLELKGFKDVTNFWNEVPLNWQPPPAPPQPDPNMLIAQAEILKAQAKVAEDQAKVETERVKLLQERQEMMATAAGKEIELALRREELHLVNDRERDKLEADIALRAAEINAKYQTQVDVASIRAMIERERMTAVTPAKSEGNGKGVQVVLPDGIELPAPVVNVQPPVVNVPAPIVKVLSPPARKEGKRKRKSTAVRNPDGSISIESEDAE